MAVGKKAITITGGCGYRRKDIRSGLRDAGYGIEIFDPMQAFFPAMLRGRYPALSLPQISRLPAPETGSASDLPAALW